VAHALLLRVSFGSQHPLWQELLMTNENRKDENKNARTDKPEEKIGDLPNQPQSDKDVDKVKGGMRKNVPQDL
jgi:hypothetical protein